MASWQNNGDPPRALLILATAVAVSCAALAGCGPSAPAPPEKPSEIDPAYSIKRLTLDSFDLQKVDAEASPRASCRMVGEIRVRPEGCQPRTLITSFVYVQDGRETLYAPSVVRPKVSAGTLRFEQPLKVPSKPGRYELRVEVMATERFKKNCPSLRSGVVCRGYVVVSSPKE